MSSSLDEYGDTFGLSISISIAMGACLVPCAMFPFLFFFILFFFLTEAEIDGKNKSHLNEYFNIQYLQVIRCCGPTSRFQALISDRG